ncbi:unnamed protein product [Pedinophyceae sp. YPF-701]|nr:unnamed protein product [Pedinophyceae sp. YPF-701]
MREHVDRGHGGAVLRSDDAGSFTENAGFAVRENDGDVGGDANRAVRKAGSKYDAVKVKVVFSQGDGGRREPVSHVLSRYLISRRLTAIKVHPDDAVRVALDLKKRLVDRGMLEVHASELESELFAELLRRSYTPKELRRYQMVEAFHRMRIPLLILIAGPASSGKTALAMQLSSRLNLPHVVQADLICSMLRSSGIAGLDPRALWLRDDLDRAAFLAEFARECAVVRAALAEEVSKCCVDGKSLIMEGSCLDPALFADAMGPVGPAPWHDGAAAGTRAAPRPAVHVGDQRAVVHMPVVLRLATGSRCGPTGRDAAGQAASGAFAQKQRWVEEYLVASDREVPRIDVRLDEESTAAALESLHDWWLACVEACVEAARPAP